MLRHPHYIRYMTGHFLSSFLGSVQYTISTDTMIQTAGHISQENSAGISAGMNYMGKDILGQLGGMSISNKIGKYSDTDRLPYFKGLMGLYQISLLAETATFMVGSTQGFVVTAGLANIGKNVAFTGFGSITANVIPEIVAKDSRKNGEVYTKINIVGSLASSLGMSVGVGMIWLVPDPHERMGLGLAVGLCKYAVMRWGLEGVYL